MADYTFFTNPMSRGQIARWALHETNAQYEQVLVDFSTKPAALLEANPMGKVPTLIHNADGGARVVTECAAICAYLAEMHPEANLHPRDEEMADYFRWLFFTAGPVESAIVTRSLGFEPEPENEGTVGWGSFNRTMSTLESWLKTHTFVCGDRFTMADVYVGSMVDWGLNFGTVPPKEAFVAYAQRMQERDAYKTAKAIDNALIAAKSA